MMKKYFHFKDKRVGRLFLVFALSLMLSGCAAGLTAEHLTMISVVATGGCWSCTMFKVVWEAIGNALTKTYGPCSRLAFILLGTGLLFWLTFTIGKMVASLKEPNMKDIIPKISGVLFKAMVVGVILSAPGYTIAMLDLFVTPILQVFVGLSKAVLFSDSSIAEMLTAPFDLLSFGSHEIEHNYKVFTRHIGTEMQDVVYRLYLTFKDGFLLGARMLIHFEFTSILLGLMIMAVFFYFMLFFPLLLLEGFVTLGFACVFFPFFLVGWVFPSTKNYINEGFKIVVQAGAQLLVTCIYIGIVVCIIHEYAEEFSPTRFLTDPMLVLGIKNMSNNGLAFMGMLYCIFKLTNEVPNITSYFVGEFNRSQVTKMFSKVQSAVKGVGKVVVGAAMVGTGVMSGAGKAMMVSGVKDTAKGFSSFQDESQRDASQDAATIRQQTQQNK